jgi:hypothetical protein
MDNDEKIRNSKLIKDIFHHLLGYEDILFKFKYKKFFLKNQPNMDDFLKYRFQLNNF